MNCYCSRGSKELTVQEFQQPIFRPRITKIFQRPSPHLHTGVTFSTLIYSAYNNYVPSTKMNEKKKVNVLLQLEKNNLYRLLTLHENYLTYYETMTECFIWTILGGAKNLTCFYENIKSF
jgi:hypothetical protein